MPTVAQRPAPGTRRPLDAMRSIASEAQSRPSDDTAAVPDWRARLIYGQRKVRNLYREVLAAHHLPRAERASIEERIARIEAELASLESTDANNNHYQNAA